MDEVPRRTSPVLPCVPLFVHCLIRVEAEGLLDYQGQAGIISIVRWNLRPVIFGVDRSPSPRPRPDPTQHPETDPKRTRNGAKWSRNGPNTPYRAILFQGGEHSRKMVRYPPLVLNFAQRHPCDTPFCNVSRDNCAIPHKNKREKVLRYYRYKYRAI